MLSMDWDAFDGIRKKISRRLCLRIDVINLLPAGQKESAEECLQKVKNIFVEFSVENSDDVVDRAHRLGKITN